MKADDSGALIKALSGTAKAGKDGTRPPRHVLQFSHSESQGAYLVSSSEESEPFVAFGINCGAI